MVGIWVPAATVLLFFGSFFFSAGVEMAAVLVEMTDAAPTAVTAFSGFSFFSAGVETAAVSAEMAVPAASDAVEDAAANSSFHKKLRQIPAGVFINNSFKF